MDLDLLRSTAILNSRVEPARPRREYYEFTPEELAAFAENIVKQCAAIADANHQQYVQYGEALAGIMLPNSADLIRQHWDIEHDVE